MKIQLNGYGISLTDAARFTDGKLLLNVPRLIRSVTTDSREVEKDSLFIALKGESSDGHEYIKKAFASGAAAVLAEHLPDTVQDGLGNIILVDNTLNALTSWAVNLKNAVGPVTAAVTGSVGKTTTKELIYSALNTKYAALKSEGNYNTEIGLLLTLLRLDYQNTALTVELGMSAKGEIERMSQIASPDAAVITNIGNSHIEKLGSRENIRDAKLEIKSGLKKDGFLILNGDEPLLSGIDKAYYVSQNDISNLRYSGGSTTFDLCCFDEMVKNITVPISGFHIAADAALAFVTSRLLGVDESDIIDAFSRFSNTGMRQKIYWMNDFTVIEDCYNASPESMTAALSVLAGYNCRKIAVLGDMRELGVQSPSLHFSVGKTASDLGIDTLVTFGKNAEAIADGFGKPDNTISFDDISDIKKIGDALNDILKSNDAVLFKASRAVALERVINYVKEVSKH